MSASRQTVSRRGFLCTAAATGLAARAAMATSDEPQTQPARPNVLLIIDDQHSPRALGWTGETQVLTPRLDAFARESVRFTNGFCNDPVCAPARHTIYSGLYPSVHGVIQNDLPMYEHVPTMMALLNQAGYTTANIGKMHNAPYHHRRDFQYVLHHEFFDTAAGISHYEPYLRHQIRERGLQPNPWWQARPGKPSWLEDVHTIAGEHWLPEDLTPERWTTDECLRFIRDQQQDRPGQPFFLHASYFPPHHPYGPIAKYARMYDPAKMDLPPNFDQGKLDRWCTGNGTPSEMTADDVRWMRAYYFGFCTQLDAEVGRLLDGLDELGVAGNTVVIFVSDHGDMLGEHGMFYKGVMYEGSVRVPFLVRWPGVSRPCDQPALVSHADLMPTILAAAGVNAPGNLPGRDIRPLLQGDNPWPDRPVYSEFLAPNATQVMLRRGTHKLFAQGRYGHWDDFRYHLFDLSEDPWEGDDLADHPDHRKTLEDLRDELMSVWQPLRAQLPPEIPPVVPRSAYNIPWSADPWKPVLPA